MPKEKVCDDTMIELEVEAKGQWPLLRTPNSSEITAPLSLSSPLLSVTFAPRNSQELDTVEDRWLSQVEIVTHAGPHRRLWMGPQFVFKTYNAPSGLVPSISRDFTRYSSGRSTIINCYLVSPSILWKRKRSRSASRPVDRVRRGRSPSICPTQRPDR